MFNGTGNNNSSFNQVNVNTRLFTSYSETAMLTATAWNNQLSIKVNPATGKDANGIVQYAQEQSRIIATSITQENAIALIHGYEDEVLPAVNGKKDQGKASITMGNAENRKVLSVGYKDGRAYFELACNVAENGTTTPENTITHLFKQKTYLKNYDHETGNGELVTVEVDLENFMEKVYKVQDLVATVAHSIKYSEMIRQSMSASMNSSGTSSPAGGSFMNPPVNNVGGTDFDQFLPMG